MRDLWNENKFYSTGGVEIKLHVFLVSATHFTKWICE
jgi:hypothetical protein